MEFKNSETNKLGFVSIFWTMNEIYIESGFHIGMGKLIRNIFGKMYWSINILGINCIILVLIEYSGILSNQSWNFIKMKKL